MSLAILDCLTNPAYENNTTFHIIKFKQMVTTQILFKKKKTF